MVLQREISLNPEFISVSEAFSIQERISRSGNNSICTRFCSSSFLDYHNQQTNQEFETSYLAGSVDGIKYLLPISHSKDKTRNVVSSHAGSPYAGLCINSNSPDVIKRAYRACIEYLEKSALGFELIEMRIPPVLVSSAVSSHEWALWSLGFQASSIYLGRYFPKNYPISMNRNRRRRINKIDRSGFDIESHDLPSTTEYELLCKNRKLRHDVKPTHNHRDFETIHNNVPGMVETFSISHDKEICAVAIVFHDSTFSTIQYLAGSQCSFSCGSQDLLVIRIVNEVEKSNKSLIFGTSTEPSLDHTEINEGLDDYKSSFGAIPYSSTRFRLKINSIS